MDWSGLDPALVWGLIPRFVGLLYVFAFGALIPQLVSILGSRGAAPLAPRLVAMRRDFGWRRFVDFPSVFWISCSDRTLQLVPVIGMFAGLLAMYGGEVGYVGLVIGWLLWLSVEPAGLIFPWDTMLQEAGFFALFLPLTRVLPDVAATALPLPTVAFMFRWLVLRLMLGFAKVKFIGTGKGDALYLRGFLIWAPMPTPLAWWAHHAPRWLLKASLYFMFVGESIAPVLGFFEGWPRLVSFALMSALMVGIQLTGNWGFFNIGFVLLSFSLLDVNASVFDVTRAPWADGALAWPDLAVHAVMGVLFFNSLFYFLFMNSWITRTWTQWSWEEVTWNRAWVRGLLRYFRALAPFHMVNGYGVFPPGSAPPIRPAPVFEGSDDGKTWKAYGFKHLPSKADSRLPIVAPYHPRFDQALHYAALGIHDGSFFSSVIGDGSPYLAYLRSSWLDRAAQQIVNGGPSAREFASDPFDGRRPKFVRVSMYLLAPTTPAELRASGKRWNVRRLGTMIPARAQEAWVEQLAVPEPELFHFDFLPYKQRALPLRAMVAAFDGGMPIDQAVQVASDLTADEVARFWRDFVPLMREGRGDWANVHQRAANVQARYSVIELHRNERILARLAWLLRLRIAAWLQSQNRTRTTLGSNFRFEMMLHLMITDGPEALRAVLDDPSQIDVYHKRSSDEDQLWTLGMLRYDMMMFHTRAFRWYELGSIGNRYNAPGIFEFFPLLSKIVPPEEDFCPTSVKHDDGEFTVTSVYPGPAMRVQHSDRT